MKNEKGNKISKLTFLFGPRPITTPDLKWHTIPLTWRLHQLILEDQISGLIRKKYTEI